MKRLSTIWIFAPLMLWASLLVGCATPDTMPYNPDLPPKPVPQVAHEDPNRALKTALGMHRLPDDLGFQEKQFDACTFGVETPGGCGHQYFTVVHFQLLCRDSEGTLSNAPGALMPIVADSMTWQLAGRTGDTQTDGHGYGQFSVVTRQSTKNKRLILHLGPKFVGFDVSEVTKIVLPRNFCRSDHA